jgi:hypothetical protein
MSSLFTDREVSEECTQQNTPIIAFTSSTSNKSSVIDILPPDSLNSKNSPNSSPASRYWLSDCFPESFILFDFGSEPVLLSGYRLAFPEIPIDEYRFMFVPKCVKLEVSMDMFHWFIVDEYPVFNNTAEISVVIPESKRDRIAKYVKISQVGLNYGGTYRFGIKQVDR